MGWLKKLKGQAESIFANHSDEDGDEKQIDEVVEQLQNEMAESQVRITNLAATVNDGRERMERLLESASRRREEAKLAVLHGADDSARRALIEEQSYRKEYQRALEETKRVEDALFHLRERIQMLETQVQVLKNRKDEYRARLQTAELAKMTADIQGGIDSRGRVFERMEEKVVRRELEAEAHGEVAGIDNEAGNGKEIGISKEAPEQNSVDEMLSKLQSELQDEGPSRE